MKIIKKMVVTLSAALVLCSYVQADTIQPKVSKATNSAITTTDLQNFRVEVEAPKGVNARELLSNVSFKAASINEVANAVDKIRLSLHPNAAVALSITQLPGAKIIPQSVSGAVNLYAAKYWWNRAASYGGAVYAYNYYVNTVACFLQVKSGSWQERLQNNGSWTNYGTIYTTTAVTASGYDNYKGCYYKGMSSYNTAHMVLYFYT